MNWACPSRYRRPRTRCDLRGHIRQEARSQGARCGRGGAAGGVFPGAPGRGLRGRERSRLSCRGLRKPTEIDVSEAAHTPEPAYHLFLASDEASVAGSAVRLLISDEAHEAGIRQLAREVLASLQATPDERGRLTVPLGAGNMKVLHSAVKLLLNDLQRENGLSAGTAAIAAIALRAGPICAKPR